MKAKKKIRRGMIKRRIKGIIKKRIKMAKIRKRRNLMKVNHQKRINLLLLLQKLKSIKRRNQ